MSRFGVPRQGYRLGWSWVCAIFYWSHQENHPRLRSRTSVRIQSVPVTTPRQAAVPLRHSMGRVWVTQEQGIADGELLASRDIPHAHR